MDFDGHTSNCFKDLNFRPSERLVVRFTISSFGVCYVVLILLVEDEPIVRKLLRNFLEMLGFRVVETSTVDGAQAIINAELVDLIISDYMLDGKSGRYLYEWILECYPGLAKRFIVISGWPEVERVPVVHCEAIYSEGT